MSQAGKPKFKYAFNWKISLFTALLMPILLSLGFWQLSRAEEKLTIQDLWQQQQVLPPQEITQGPSSTPGLTQSEYRRVRVQGVFDTVHYWLLENKIQNGRLGYHIIMPFKLNSGQVMVVNRGWVVAKPLRDQLPEFTTPQTALTVTGNLASPSDSAFIDEAKSPLLAWPHRILEIDLSLMSAQYGSELGGQVLRLDAESPGALAIDWQPVNMTPAKHVGYAVQWFAMAFALSILYVFASSNLAAVLSYRRPNEK